MIKNFADHTVEGTVITVQDQQPIKKKQHKGLAWEDIPPRFVSDYETSTEQAATAERGK